MLIRVRGLSPEAIELPTTVLLVLIAAPLGQAVMLVMALLMPQSVLHLLIIFLIIFFLVFLRRRPGSRSGVLGPIDLLPDRIEFLKSRSRLNDKRV